MGVVPTLALADGYWIILVVFIAAPLAAVAFTGAGAVYRQIGKGAFAMDHELRPAPGEGDGASPQVQEAEIRQMLEAKAFRQAGRGGPALDVEAELEKLLGAGSDLSADPALVEEVRQLVLARNHRRLRAGKEPLDVESEIAGQLRDLENLGQ